MTLSFTKFMSYAQIALLHISLSFSTFSHFVHLFYSHSDASKTFWERELLITIFGKLKREHKSNNNYLCVHTYIYFSILTLSPVSSYYLYTSTIFIFLDMTSLWVMRHFVSSKFASYIFSSIVILFVDEKKKIFASSSFRGVLHRHII